MKKEVKQIFSVVILIGLIIASIGFVVLYFYKDNWVENTFKQNYQSDVVDKETSDLDSENDNDENTDLDESVNVDKDTFVGNNGDVTVDPVEYDTYTYSFDVISVTYEPDADHFVGFQICDNANSICTVYGVPNSYIAKATLGQDFTILFNEFENKGVAAGTTYNEITSPADEFEMIPRDW